MQPLKTPQYIINMIARDAIKLARKRKISEKDAREEVLRSGEYKSVQWEDGLRREIMIAVSRIKEREKEAKTLAERTRAPFTRVRRRRKEKERKEFPTFAERSQPPEKDD